MLQIYKEPKGGVAVLVRTEDRGSGLEYFFEIVRDGLVMTRWTKELPPAFELIHDPGARAETEVFRVEANALIREKEILLDCLQAALGMLDERSAEQVRDIWRQRTKDMPLISMTKGA